jgi:outer membrane protein TolC
MTENYLITSLKLKTSFIFLVCVALVGCIGNNNPTVEPFQPSSVLTYDKPIALEANSSALVQAIVSNPAVSRALTSAAVAKERVPITRSQKKMTMSASGSSGFEADTDDGSEGVLIVGVTAQKLLNDNGKTDRAIYLSELLAETAKLESQIAFDQALQQILDAYIARSTALEVDRIITYYVALFNEREDLVQTAVDAGVLSNSDYLELQSLKNEILSEQAQSVFQSNTSASFLRTSLGSNYDAAVAELVNRYTATSGSKLSTENSNQITLLGLKKSQIQTEIELQKLSNTLTTNWQSTVSSPKSRGAGSTLFAGITMSLPINDGGRSLATIAALQKEFEVNALEVSTYEQEVTLAQQGLDNFFVYYEDQKILLNERKRIAEDRVVELELKLKTGRAGVSALAKEFLALARTEMAIERLDFDRKSQTLSALSVTGQTCELVRLCDAIGHGNSRWRRLKLPN